MANILHIPIEIIEDLGSQRACILIYLTNILKYSKLNYIKLNYSKIGNVFRIVSITCKSAINDLIELNLLHHLANDTSKIQIDWLNLYQRYPSLIPGNKARAKLLDSENIINKLWVNHNLPLPTSLSKKLGGTKILSRITEWGKLVFYEDYNHYTSLYRRYRHNALLLQYLTYIAKVYMQHKDDVSTLFRLSFSDYNKSFEVLHRYIDLHKSMEYKVMLDVNDQKQVNRFFRTCRQLELVKSNDLRILGIKL